MWGIVTRTLKIGEKTGLFGWNMKYLLYGGLLEDVGLDPALAGGAPPRHHRQPQQTDNNSCILTVYVKGLLHFIFQRLFWSMYSYIDRLTRPN
jgi:hypothetical protein